MTGRFPLLEHELKAPTAFTPESLVDAVRTSRRIRSIPIPEVCVLEFDGDLTDWLISTRKVRVFGGWACFHTTMYSLEVDGSPFGIVPRTIGGPYAVLVAEQMAVSGARVVLGLTSAGRVSASMPVPGLVVATKALRDEGTSYHYLPASSEVRSPPRVASFLAAELRTLRLPVVRGMVWTTDAPYRETSGQISRHADEGLLAVEMQAASLFAFSMARRFPVGLVAHVTNSVDQKGSEFDKGSRQSEFEILQSICRAGKKFVETAKR